MKKSQLSIFLIIGVVLVIIIGIFLLTMSEQGRFFLSNNKDDISTQPIMRADINNFVSSCVKYSVQESLSKTGIREENLENYESEIYSETKKCVSPLFSDLEKQNYVIKEGELTIDAALYPESILVKAFYPVSIKKEGQKIDFDVFEYSFDRSNSVEIPNGITNSEIILKSSNGKAELKIPKGVELKDKDGNLVDKISMKVEDLHFDGLENKYVLGELTYNNLPDETFFSEPVEMSIEFDELEIPEEYTKENINIAYWDEKIGVWKAVDTEIHDNLAVAKIIHFTHYATIFSKKFIIENHIFEQRFYPTGPEVWVVDKHKGTATLNPEIEGIEGLKSIENFEDWEETQDKLEEYYIYPPITEYSYEDDDGNLIKCEEEIVKKESRKDEKGNVKEVVIKQSFDKGYPKINYQTDLNLESYNGCYCSSCEGTTNSDCSTFCKDKPIDGKSINDFFCLPLSIIDESDERYDSEKCTYECGKKELSKIGYHSMQCSSGNVIPGNGKPAADFIVLEPNGNGVIHVNFWTGKSTLEVFTYPSAVGGDNTRIVDIIKQKIVNHPYLCSLILYPDGSDYKEFTLEDGSPAYGIYGIKVDREDVSNIMRQQMETRGTVYYYFKGNGYLRSNTPDTNLGGYGNYLPLSEKVSWVQSVLPDFIRVYFRDLGDQS